MATVGAENAPPKALEGRLGQLSCIYILISKRLCHQRSPSVLPHRLYVHVLTVPQWVPVLCNLSNPNLPTGTPAKTRELEGRSPNSGINCPVAQTGHSASPKLNFLIWKLGRPIPVCPYSPTRHDVGEEGRAGWGGVVRMK